jgi:type IV pilus assembly protein PilC
MATFRYKMRGEAGKVVQGTVAASDLNDALGKVRKLGGVPLEVKESRPSGGWRLPFLQPRLSLKERIVFTEQLAVMLRAGITLVQALRGLEEESTNKALKRILQDLITDIEGGAPFSSALEKHPRVFSNIFSQMVRSAETTGTVADILQKLSLQQQKEYELRGKVRGALMYPAIVCVLLVGVIGLVITFILPKLSGMFTESGTELPLSTRILLKMSDIMINQWYLMVVGLVIAGVSFKMILANPRGRWYWDMLIIRIPVIGSLLRKSYLARFTQSFASLSQAGVPVLDIFKTLRGVVGNSVYEAELERIASDVANGVKVSLAIRKSKYFPGMVGQLISVGEQSGDLAGVFTVLGDFYEKEVDGLTKNLSTLLEPIIMLVMGVAIGFVLISVLQPIYGLVNSV